MRKKKSIMLIPLLVLTCATAGTMQRLDKVSSKKDFANKNITKEDNIPNAPSAPVGLCVQRLYVVDKKNIYFLLERCMPIVFMETCFNINNLCKVMYEECTSFPSQKVEVYFFKGKANCEEMGYKKRCKSGHRVGKGFSHLCKYFNKKI